MSIKKLHTMESVWYSAANDWMLIRRKHGALELGCQGMVWDETFKGFIPDVLNLFRFKINPKLWKRHRKKGWLIRLGEL